MLHIFPVLLSKPLAFNKPDCERPLYVFTGVWGFGKNILLSPSQILQKSQSEFQSLGLGNLKDCPSWMLQVIYSTPKRGFLLCTSPPTRPATLVGSKLQYPKRWSSLRSPLTPQGIQGGIVKYHRIIPIPSTWGFALSGQSSPLCSVQTAS